MSDPNSPRRPLAAVAEAALFFIPFYLYVFLRIDPALIYHGFVSRFLLSEWRGLTGTLAQFPLRAGPLSIVDESFRQFLSRPGGLTEYAAAALSEFYFIPWLGALIITLATVAVCLATGELVAAVGGRRDNPVRFLPAILLLAFYSQFANPLLFSLGVLAALVGAMCYIRYAGRGACTRAGVFAAVCVAAYYLAGGACLLIALIGGLFELLHARRRALAGLCLALGLAVPLAGATLTGAGGAGWAARLLPFFVEADGSLRLLLVEGRLGITGAAAAISAFLLLVVVLQKRASQNATPHDPRRESQRWLNPWRRLKATPARWIVVPLAMAALAAAVALPLFDATTRALLRLDYCAEQCRWQEVLHEARACPPQRNAASIQHEVIRALYHRGRLLDDLFDYPVALDGLVMVKHEQLNCDMSKLARTYFEMGRVNEAERLAQNWLEGFGERPVLLRLLARINIVKGRTPVAQAYLVALRRYRQWRAWADAMSERLQRDPLLASDPDVRRVRSLMLTDNRIVDLEFSQPERRWLDLLDKQPGNRMAFEYLSVYYLLSGNLAGLVENLHRLQELGYDRIPRHYEEALVLYVALTKKQVDLFGKPVSRKTQDRFAQACSVLRHCDAVAPVDKRFAAKALNENLGDSYFRYYYLLPMGRANR